MTFTMIFTWISSLPCLFLFKFKILNQKGILWMVLSSHESKLAIFPQKKPDPTNQVTPFDLFFFPPWISHGLQAGSVWPVWHCALLWFGCGEGAGNRKKGSVEEFLWIELPIGNRDTFCVGCLFTSLPGALWGWECGVDFGVSSKFQGVSSNLLLLKLVTLPSSSLQTCQNPDLLPPFFFWHRGFQVLNLTNVKQKMRSKIWVTRIRMSRSWWRCCDTICWKPSCRLVMDDSFAWRWGITCLDTWMWGSRKWRCELPE